MPIIPGLDQSPERSDRAFQPIRSPADLAPSIRLYEIRGLTQENILPTNGLWFPITPSEYGVSSSYDWASINIIGMGEVKHRSGNNVDSIELQGFFPGYYDPRLCKGLRRPEDYLAPEVACNVLKALKEGGEVFGMVVGGGDQIDEKVFITEFTWTHKRTLDREFSIRFETWESQTVKQRGGIKLAPVPRAYRLRPGEDLQDAALRIYGHVRNWPALAAANKKKAIDSIALSLSETQSVLQGVDKQIAPFAALDLIRVPKDESVQPDNVDASYIRSTVSASVAAAARARQQASASEVSTGSVLGDVL